MDDKIDAPLQPEIEGEGVKEETQEPSDRLTPDHPRFKQVIEKNHLLETQVNELQEQLNELRESRTGKSTTEEYSDEEREALDKIKRAGFMTKEEAKALIDEEVSVERGALALRDLSQRYKGDNGLPKFDAAEVVTHAKKLGLRGNSIEELDMAYRDLHFDAFVQSTSKKLTEASKPPVLEKPTGGERIIPQTELTPEQIENMSPEEYEKNRDKILSGVKSAVK